MQRTAAVPEEAAAPAAEHGVDLRHRRQRDLLGGPGTQIDADRPVDPLPVVGMDDLIGQGGIFDEALRSPAGDILEGRGDVVEGSVRFLPVHPVGREGGQKPVLLLTLDWDELLSVARSRVTRSLTEGECEAYRVDPCPTLEELRQP